MECIAVYLFQRIWNEATVVAVAALPILELRGSIPLALHLGLTWQEAFLFSFIGNMLPIAPLILLTRKLLERLKKIALMESPFTWFEKHIRSKQRYIARYSGIGLVILVAIPLPGTGAWTAAMLASIIDLRMKHALPAIALGVLVADVIVTALTYGLFGLT